MSCPFRLAALIAVSVNLKSKISNWHVYCSFKEFGHVEPCRDICIMKAARIFHELLSREHEDGCATWQPQGVGFEAYPNGTSQGPTPEDARKDGHIRGRSK